MYAIQARPTSSLSSERLALRLLRRQSSNAESSRSSACSLASAVLKPGVGTCVTPSALTSLLQSFLRCSRYFGSLHCLNSSSTSAWPSLSLSTPGTAQCRKRSYETTSAPGLPPPNECQAAPKLPTLTPISRSARCDGAILDQLSNAVASVDKLCA